MCIRDSHSHDPSTCCGSSNSHGDGERAKRKPGQWVHLYRSGGDQFHPGSVSYAAIADGDGERDLCGGTDGRRSEYCGGGLERYHVNGAIGEGQCREHL